jgi:N,N'-diacetyllegionaminate synthase
MGELRTYVPRQDGSTGALIIAEVAQSHDGSLGQAHAFIDAVAKAGADAIKFQTHIAAAESTPAEPWRVRFSQQDETRYEYWRRMEFTEPQWQGLADHAAECELLFLSSAFSMEAVDLLDRLGMQMWKVASGEVTNLALIRRMAQTGKPVLLSSGMSGLAELDRAVGVIREVGAPVVVLQCATAYPCPPSQVGLNVLEDFRTRYECPVGLSDHSGTIFPGLAAVTLGAEVVEVHVAFSREMFGPDVPASLTTAELADLVQGIRFIEAMLAAPVDKDAVADAMAPMRHLFTKSVVTKAALPSGTALREEHLAAKKPGTGIPASAMSDVVGRHLRHDVAFDQVLTEDDLEPV